MTLIAYTNNFLNWKLGAGHPTNPERARLAVEKLMNGSSADNMVLLNAWENENRDEWVTALADVHSEDHINYVLVEGRSSDWAGVKFHLSETALTMFGATYSLVSEYLNGSNHKVFFNPQGAKHHAAWDQSSGFCVFNDMASAALRLTAAGKRVVYIDWDAHHGDGVEDILLDRPDIITYSIHEGNLFPWSGFESGEGFQNYPLAENANDVDLLEAMHDVVSRIHDDEPDVILLACGADGLAADPLSSLNYTLGGLDAAAGMVGLLARDLGASVIIGGAGGYQPHTETPEHWARTVSIISEIVEGD